MKIKRIYKVKNHARWFLVQGTRADCLKEGKQELGSNCKISLATEGDINYFKSIGRTIETAIS